MQSRNSCPLKEPGQGSELCIAVSRGPDSWLQKSSEQARSLCVSPSTRWPPQCWEEQFSSKSFNGLTVETLSLQLSLPRRLAAQWQSHPRSPSTRLERRGPTPYRLHIVLPDEL